METADGTGFLIHIVERMQYTRNLNILGSRQIFKNSSNERPGPNRHWNKGEVKTNSHNPGFGWLATVRRETELLVVVVSDKKLAAMGGSGCTADY